MRHWLLLFWVAQHTTNSTQRRTNGTDLNGIERSLRTRPIASASRTLTIASVHISPHPFNSFFSIAVVSRSTDARVYLPFILAQLSRSVTVRLNTNAPGFESTTS